MRIIIQQQVQTNDARDKTYLLMRIISQQQVHDIKMIQETKHIS